VCGHKIFDKPYKVIIEGARLIVCSECSKLGKVIWQEDAPKQTEIVKKRTFPSPVQFQIRRTPPPQLDTTQEIVQNYDSLIRQAREKLGLSHEELGKRLNEKISVLRKIETGKMTPNNTLSTKLEHVLKIKLIVPAKEEKVPEAKIQKKIGKELTLGDLIKIEDKEEIKEDKIGRKRS
jgi:putative transcription factor